MREKGEFERLTKKEGLMLTRKIEKLESRFGGIRKMHRLPDLVFIVDVRREETAVKEANTLGIPIVALVDTNVDPRDIDYVIPSNDDAIRAIKLMVGHFADAVLEGKAMRKDEEEEVPVPVEAVEEELSDDDLLGASTLAKMEAAAESTSAEEADADSDEEMSESSDGVEEKPESDAEEKKDDEKSEEEDEVSEEETTDDSGEEE
jgi:small subunit ribosomal protein S2